MSVFSQKASAPMATDTPPAGNQPAALVALIDLGTHTEEYQGVAKKSHKVYLLWELTEAPVAGQPSRNHVIGNRYTLSLAPSAKLRELIDGWRPRKLGDGEAFELTQLLGKKCFVTVGHQAKNDRTYANIKSVAPVPLVKGKPVEVADPKYVPFTFEIATGDLKDIEAKDWLPYCYGTSIAELIEDSAEYRKLKGKPAADEPLADGEGAEEAVTAPDGGPLEDAPW